MRELVDRIKALIPTNPRLIDMSVDSLTALRYVGITWEELQVVTRGEMIDARIKAVDEFNNENYLVRVKCRFAPGTWDTINKLADDKGISVAEVIRKALSLYVSVDQRIMSHGSVILRVENMP